MLLSDAHLLSPIVTCRENIIVQIIENTSVYLRAAVVVYVFGKYIEQILADYSGQIKCKRPIFD